MTQGFGGRRPPLPREGCAGLLGRKQRHWHLGGFGLGCLREGGDWKGVEGWAEIWYNMGHER